MEVVCPACGKPNENAEDRPRCRRCGCELGSLVSLLQTAEQHLAAGAEALRNAQWAEAMHHTVRAWRIQHTPRAAQMALLAALGLGDKQAVTRWLFRMEAAK